MSLDKSADGHNELIMTSKTKQGSTLGESQRRRPRSSGALNKRREDNVSISITLSEVERKASDHETKHASIIRPQSTSSRSSLKADDMTTRICGHLYGRFHGDRVTSQ